LVVTWHNLVITNGWKAVVYGAAERYVARRSDVTLGASQDLVTRASSLGANAQLGPVAAPKARQPERTRDEVRTDLALGDRPLLLAIGRLHPQKDYPTLFAAMEFLAGREAPPALVVVGDGPERAHLMAAAQRSGSITLVGHRNDTADLLHAADIFVLSSRWEARALVVQEAMQAGLPVVATSVGGIPDLVGDHALLVRPGDPVALAHAIEASLDDPASAAQRAQRAKKHAESWPDDDAVVESLIETYRAVVAER
jgi:glycosyltransferase involved in cell wall biosynthesis